MKKTELEQKFMIGDKSFSALSSEEQKKILAKNPNAERKAISRARKHVGGYEKVFKAGEEAKTLLAKLRKASTDFWVAVKKAGLNGTSSASQKIDDAIKQVGQTLDKEVRLKQGQQGSPMDKILEQQMKRDYR